MNKRELVNWLENKKQEVLRANDAYYEETIKKEQERLLQERKSLKQNRRRIRSAKNVSPIPKAVMP